MPSPCSESPKFTRSARSSRDRATPHGCCPRSPAGRALGSSWAILEGPITIVLESTSHEKTGATGACALEACVSRMTFDKSGSRRRPCKNARNAPDSRQRSPKSRLGRRRLSGLSRLRRPSTLLDGQKAVLGLLRGTRCAASPENTSGCMPGTKTTPEVLEDPITICQRDGDRREPARPAHVLQSARHHRHAFCAAPHSVFTESDRICRLHARN
jgi:hypothetical protein